MTVRRQTRFSFAIFSPIRRLLLAMLSACCVAASLPATARSEQEQSPEIAPPELDLVVEGRTLSEWRRQISLLPLYAPPDDAVLRGLIGLVQQPNVPWFTRRQAALTLGRLGSHAPQGIPVLVELLHSQNTKPSDENRLWVIRALSLYGPVAAETTPDLIRVFQAPTSTLYERLGVMDAFSRIGPAHPAVIPFLTNQVALHEISALAQESSSHLNGFVRLGAIEALGAIGGSASSAIPLLIRVLEEEDEQIRREAATALGRMGPVAAMAGPALLQRLIDEPVPAVQDQVAWALGEIGPETVQEELPRLFGAMSPVLRRYAVEIHGRWGQAVSSIQPAIQLLWIDPDAQVRLSALEASKKLGVPSEKIARPLVQEFLSEDRQVRRRATQLFDQLGHAGQIAEPELRALLENPRTEVRLAARKGLQSCGLEE